jgi:uroporphyrin-3 C-methyltransferase/uroporphyrinogen III methyltransferase/synthase
MPLLSDEKPAIPVTPPKNARVTFKSADARSKPAGGRTGRSADWISGLQDKWDSWANEMWGEMKQLVRVREVDTPDALLLSPTQAYYARENLKLRLLNARLNLLSRNVPTFRSDMLAAQDIITKYFDTHAKQTQTVEALLKQTQNNNQPIQMPTLAESLNAVRNYKAR